MKAIEGLSRSGEHYVEAVELLQARFNRPRLIHQTHVSRILNTPSLKEGSRRELRHLHDTIQQHLRALKAMDYEPSSPFITSVLELKLDAATMFEWQKHSQSSTEVPHYQDLLKFIDLQAQASETSIVEQAKGSSRIGSSLPNKTTVQNRPQLTSFITSTSGQTGNNCIACNDGSKHPLHACSKFKAFFHENKLTLLKNSKLCFNGMYAFMQIA